MRGQLLLQVIAIYLRESSGPEQGKPLKQPRQLKMLQPGKNASLPEFLNAYVGMVNWLVRRGDGEEEYKERGELQGRPRFWKNSMLRSRAAMIPF